MKMAVSVTMILALWQEYACSDFSSTLASEEYDVNQPSNLTFEPGEAQAEFQTADSGQGELIVQSTPGIHDAFISMPPENFPTASILTEDEQARQVPWRWVPIRWTWNLVVQLISAIVGIVGNLLVIVILFQRRAKSRSMDTLIGGLAVADFLTSVFIIPIPRASSVPKTWQGEVYCRLISTQLLLWSCITASSYLLMSISVERYLAVVFPFQFNRYVTRRRVSIFIAVVWLLSLLSGIHAFIVYGVKDLTQRCGERYLSERSRVIIAIYWFCLRLVIPCFTMIITQLLIARQLNKQAAFFNDAANTHAVEARKQTPSFHIVARNRVIKMMFIVILIYIICWSPNQIAFLGYNLGWVPLSFLNSPLQQVLTVLGFFNSCANPVIYAARYPEFRAALRDMFTCTSPTDTPLFEKAVEPKNDTTITQCTMDNVQLSLP
ncbi:allatostatin-A receptor-like [Diadema antillarum]|uniref:allatostatin-A receptor-like n=1 Tax=Diadema antillarum TaxID=105358 RepID=UPI003A89C804